MLELRVRCWSPEVGGHFLFAVCFLLWVGSLWSIGGGIFHDYGEMLKRWSGTTSSSTCWRFRLFVSNMARSAPHPPVGFGSREAGARGGGFAVEFGWSD